MTLYLAIIGWIGAAAGFTGWWFCNECWAAHCKQVIDKHYATDSRVTVTLIGAASLNPLSKTLRDSLSDLKN